MPTTYQEAPLTTREFAAAAHVHEDTVRRWVKDGLLPAIRVGRGRLRFRQQDLDLLLTPRSSVGGGGGDT